MMENTNNHELKEAGYQKLEVYQLSHTLAIRIHKMSLELPKFEMHEQGSQMRRSAKSVPANIVEGYILRKYKNEFPHYLYRSYASSEETVQHLKIIFETSSLRDEKSYDEVPKSYHHLNAMLFKFIQGVEAQHETPYYVKESETDYNT